MHINAPLRVHQIPHEDQPFINHGDEGIGAAAPGIAVGDLFEQVGFFVEGFAADFDIHGEVGADVEGRVNVDEFEAAGVFDLAAEGTALERGEDEFVIAPDELVGPALDLASAQIEAEFLLLALLFPGFVNMFEGLERQDGGADFAGLAVPDQFHLALVGEEQEPVLLRQRLALLNELDEVALLGLGQFVGGFVGFTHGFPSL